MRSVSLTRRQFSSIRRLAIFVVHHCGLHLFAVLSGLPHEVVQVVLAAHPVQFVHSGADPPVEVVNLVREEAALLGIERVEDLVVVSHHEQDVLPQDAVRFALRVDLHCDVGDFQMHPLPLVHLLEELEEVPVEVGLEQALFESSVKMRLFSSFVAMAASMVLSHSRCWFLT